MSFFSSQKIRARFQPAKKFARYWRNQRNDLYNDHRIKSCTSEITSNGSSELFETAICAMSTPTPTKPQDSESDVPVVSPADSLYSICRHEILDKTCGIPMPTKDDTKNAIAALIQDDRPPVAGVFGNGPLLVSDIPASAAKENAEVVLGIEYVNFGIVRKSRIVSCIILLTFVCLFFFYSEAGRGCVLGPMTYGCAYWSMEVDDSIPKGFRDSKQMKEEGELASHGTIHELVG